MLRFSPFIVLLVLLCPAGGTGAAPLSSSSGGGGGGGGAAKAPFLHFVLVPEPTEASFFPAAEVARRLHALGHRATVVLLGNAMRQQVPAYGPGVNTVTLDVSLPELQRKTAASSGSPPPCRQQQRTSHSLSTSCSSRYWLDWMKVKLQSVLAFPELVLGMFQESSRRRLDFHSSLKHELAPGLENLGSADFLISTEATDLAVAYAARSLNIGWASLCTGLLMEEEDGLNLHIPAPFSGLPTYETLQLSSRLIVLFYRLMGRLSSLREQDEYVATGGHPESLTVGRHMVLATGGFGIERARSLPPWLAMVGPVVPEATALPRDEQRWMSSSPLVGVVVVHCEEGMWSEQVKVAIATGIAAAGGRVFWLGSGPKQASQANVSVDLFESMNGSLVDAMAHDSVTAFLGTGLLWHSQVSLLSGKPVISVTTSAEEEEVAWRLSQLGVGTSLGLAEVDSHSISDAVQSVHTFSHRSQALDLAKIMRQENLSPIPLLLHAATDWRSEESEGGNSWRSWAQGRFLDVLLVYMVVAWLGTKVAKATWSISSFILGPTSWSEESHHDGLVKSTSGSVDYAAEGTKCLGATSITSSAGSRRRNTRKNSSSSSSSSNSKALLGFFIS
jgi:hypothetical protein